MNFHPNSEILKQDYLDIFEGARSDVTCRVKYDEYSDIVTTYLGTFKMGRQDELKAEHKASITEDIPAKLLVSINCKVLLDM